jgi:hypothetical protein
MTTTTATEPLFSKCWTKAKTKSRLSYAYLALGDFRFPATHAERERAAVGEPFFAPGDGAHASFGRPA